MAGVPAHPVPVVAEVEAAPESDAAERAGMEEARRPPTPTDEVVDRIFKRAGEASAKHGGPVAADEQEEALPEESGSNFNESGNAS